MENKEMDPQVYFDYIKEKKEEMTDEFLKSLHDIIMKQLTKAMITGQNLQVKRLAYSLGVLKREHKLVELGLDTYVLRENIEEYIDKVADKAVKIIDLEFYPREIPDEIVNRVQQLKELSIFDNYYVVYTDYTGEGQKAVEEERRRRDPILFGTFEQKIDNLWDIADRFYFIGDWEDEYCDLTLTKMVQEMSKKGKDILNTVSLETVTEDEVRSYVNNLKETEEASRFNRSNAPKKSFFKRVRTAWEALVK